MSACMGQQGHSTLDEVERSVEGAWVEAFVEYGGPQEQWAGPAHFILHVNAKDASPKQLAQISMTPSAFQEADYSSVILGAGRMPASTADLHGPRVRERIAALAAELDKQPDAFQGCLNPVRVRIVSASGKLFEKQGCRGNRGWVKAASRFVADFMSAAAQAQADREAALATQKD